MPASEPASEVLGITLFGPMQVRIEGQPLPHLRSRKVLWLLALLTLRHDRPVEREWLAATLWPDVSQARALSNLRVIVSKLRQALGSAAHRLQSTNRHNLYIDLNGMDVDSRAFDTAIRSRNLPALERAVALYRGPLLEDCTEEWVLSERERREQDCLQALQTLGDAARETGDYETAVGYYRRALGLDPWRDAARRGLMDVLACKGDRNAALQIYQEYVAQLRETPQMAPDEETQTLYNRLRAEAPEHTVLPPVVAPTPHVPAVKGYVPHALTELVGREEERIEIAHCLRRSRLVTLTGVGGIGKTRLAMAVARDVVREYADGVSLVALEALTEAPQVILQIASVLGVKEEPGRGLPACVTDHLRTKRLLLVLDNSEHLVEACATVVESILRECAGVRILVTSREALGITGEMVWTVPTLTVPDVEQLPEASDTLLPLLGKYEAVELFIKRTQAAQEDFALAEDNARVIAQICTQLEGIPLAIELAASRIKENSLEQIHAHLGNFLGIGSVKGAPPLSRQQTLRATLDWSYALLTEAERLLLQRLSVFAGGCTLEAAEAVCSDSKATEAAFPILKGSDILPLLTALVDKSLLTFGEEEPAAGGRFRMLEMVRQFAGERFAASGEAPTLMARHQDWFVALAEEADPQLSGPAQAEWLRRLAAEYDNLRLVLARSEQGLCSGEGALRLACAMRLYWYIRGDITEGRKYLTQALAHQDAQARTRTRAKALNGLGAQVRRLSDLVGARTLFEESLAIRRELGEGKAIAETIANLGIIQHDLGNYAASRALYEESLSIHRQLGDKAGMAITLANLGATALNQGDLIRAREQLSEGLQLYRELGDRAKIAWALNTLGNVTTGLGDLLQAETMHEESLVHLNAIGDRNGIAWTRNFQGNIAFRRGDYTQAQALHQESLNLFRDLGEKYGMALALQFLGETAFAQGELASAQSLLEESRSIYIERRIKQGIAWTVCTLGSVSYAQGDATTGRALFKESLSLFKETEGKIGIATTLQALATAMLDDDICFAVSLWGAEQSLRENISLAMPLKEQDKYDHQLSQTRAALGEDAFIAAWETGRALTWEQATDYALEKLNA